MDKMDKNKQIAIKFKILIHIKIEEQYLNAYLSRIFNLRI